MNKIAFFSLVLILGLAVSCNNKPKDVESIKKEIAEYEAKILEYRNKIDALKSTLDTMNLVETEGRVLVETMDITFAPFVNYIDVVGNIESDFQALISPEINGQIERIYVIEGEFVKKGSPLFSLKTEVTDKSVKEVETALDLAKTVYKKQKELWDQKIGSEIQYLQAKNNKESLEMRLETLKAQLRMADVLAPFDGYIETVFQKEGEIASPGRQVLELVNLDNLKINADVSESYIADIQVGDRAIVTLPSYPGFKLEAPVSVVGSVINPNNRTFNVQVKVTNKDKMFKPNLITNLKLTQSVLDSAIVVPSIIVKNDATGHKYIYVLKEKNNQLVAEKQFIEVGTSYGNNTVVLSGLNIGDKVIEKGYNLVKNGSLIRIK